MIRVTKIIITQVIDTDVNVGNRASLDKFRENLERDARIDGASIDVIFWVKTDDLDECYPIKHREKK